MIHGIALILLGLWASLQASGALFSCDPALRPLFTPAHPMLGRYEICTDSAPVAADGWHLAAPERLEALDAFGSAGLYDRARLTRLFGGQRVTVVRGWRQSVDGFESVVLLSPYPDPSLERLNPGTMIIRWILEGPSRGSLQPASN